LSFFRGHISWRAMLSTDNSCCIPMHIGNTKKYSSYMGHVIQPLMSDILLFPFLCTITITLEEWLILVMYLNYWCLDVAFHLPCTFKLLGMSICHSWVSCTLLVNVKYIAAFNLCHIKTALQQYCSNFGHVLQTLMSNILHFLFPYFSMNMMHNAALI
jgi:hypothetical protein